MWLTQKTAQKIKAIVITTVTMQTILMMVPIKLFLSISFLAWLMGPTRKNVLTDEWFGGGEGWEGRKEEGKEGEQEGGREGGTVQSWSGCCNVQELDPPTLLSHKLCQMWREQQKQLRSQTRDHTPKRKNAFTRNQIGQF